MADDKKSADAPIDDPSDDVPQPKGGSSPDDVGNDKPSTLGAPQSEPGNGDASSLIGASSSEQTGHDGSGLTTIAHPEGNHLPEGAEPAEGSIEATEVEHDRSPLLTDEEMAEVVWAALRDLARVRGNSSLPVWGHVDTNKQVELIEHIADIRATGALGHPLITAMVHAIDDNDEDLADDE